MMLKEDASGRKPAVSPPSAEIEEAQLKSAPTLPEALEKLVGRRFAETRDPDPKSWPGYLMGHTLRVVALSRLIAAREGADVEVAEAAAYLHDIKKPVGENHGFLGALDAERILAGLGKPEGFIRRVSSAIRSHDPPPEERGSDFMHLPAENRVLYDADYLDANFTVHALLRYVTYYAREAPPGSDRAGYVKSRMGDDRARGSWVGRRRAELSLLKTGEGRRLGRACVDYMDSFVAGLESESSSGGDMQRYGLTGLVSFFTGRSEEPDIDSGLAQYRNVVLPTLEAESAGNPGALRNLERLRAFFKRLDGQYD